jgi:hypothetical protein
MVREGKIVPDGCAASTSLSSMGPYLWGMNRIADVYVIGSMSLAASKVAYCAESTSTKAPAHARPPIDPQAHSAVLRIRR